MLLKVVPIVYRKRRGASSRLRRAPGPPAPPAALVLVGATCEEGNWVRLVFDRAIDISGLVGSQVVVDDGDSTMTRYAGTGGATLIAPNVVQVELVAIGEWTEPGLTLNATGGTGIVAVDDGGAWAGVVGLALPWP